MTGQPTYGELIGRATTELTTVLTEPITLAGTGDLVHLIGARDRIYRVLNTALRTHTGLAPASVAGAPAWSKRVHNLIDVVTADLDALTEASRSMRELLPPTPQPESATVRRLRRGADYAGAAFDLLTTHVALTGRAPTSEGQHLVQGDAHRAILADVLTLAGAVAKLDKRLLTPLRGAIKQFPDGHQLRRVLIAVRDDCGRPSVAHIGAATLRSARRGGVDETTPASVIAPRPTVIRSAQEAVTALDQLRTWTELNADALNVISLRDVAAVAGRVGRLAGFVHRYLGHHTAVEDAATAAATGWRAVFTELRPFMPVHPAPRAGVGSSLAHWIDGHLQTADARQALATVIADDHLAAHGWRRATQALTAQLPQVADSVLRSVYAQQAAGRLAAPVRDAANRRLFVPLPPFHHHSVRLDSALATAQQTSTTLARSALQASRPTHPRPDLVQRAVDRASGTKKAARPVPQQTAAQLARVDAVTSSGAARPAAPVAGRRRGVDGGQNAAQSRARRPPG